MQCINFQGYYNFDTFLKSESSVVVQLLPTRYFIHTGMDLSNEEREEIV
jgi:hypothetical protein